MSTAALVVLRQLASSMSSISQQSDVFLYALYLGPTTNNVHMLDACIIAGMHRKGTAAVARDISDAARHQAANLSALKALGGQKRHDHPATRHAVSLVVPRVWFVRTVYTSLGCSCLCIAHLFKQKIRSSRHRWSTYRLELQRGLQSQHNQLPLSGP